MAMPAYSPQSQIALSDKFGGTQLDLLSSVWNSPEFNREEPGTFALSFSPTMVRHLIHTYSRPGETVLDCFLGTGTTVVEAQLMGRHSIGIDCNDRILETAHQRLTVWNDDCKPTLYCADARTLSTFIEEDSVDLVVTQPPYGSTHAFSSNNPHDLSLFSSRDFLLSIEQIATELYRVLKPGGYCILLVGDIKDRGRMMPLGFQFIHRFLSRGFSVSQSFDSRTPTTLLPVPLNDHEYLFIFQKKGKAPKHSRLTC